MKIDKHTHRDWRTSNEGNNSGFTDRYNRGLLEGYDNDWDDTKVNYKKLFERHVIEAKPQWKERNDMNKIDQEG